MSLPWQEARQQERMIKQGLIDVSKRAQRRSEHYEKIKSDPAQFLQLHASKCRVFVDVAIARQADSSTALRGWQGDPNVKIDRFDVRAHLDVMPTVSSRGHALTDEEDALERQMCYERYRILVGNEFQKIHEERFLKSIYVEEQLGKAYDPKLSTANNRALVKAEEAKKKKLTSKKAAIGFSYDDGGAATVSGTSGGQSTAAYTSVKQSGGARIKDYSKDNRSNHRDSGGGDSDSDDSDSNSDADMDSWDSTLDVKSLRPDQCRALNKIAHKYGMEEEDFIKHLWADREELEQRAELKKLEDAKAQYVMMFHLVQGRSARRERQALKESRIMLMGKTKVNPAGATTTLLSFKKNRDAELAAERKQKLKLYGRDSDGSSSEDEGRSGGRSSSSGRNGGGDGIVIANEGRAEFITTFGGEDEERKPTNKVKSNEKQPSDEEDEDEAAAASQVRVGPSLPPNDVWTDMERAAAQRQSLANTSTTSNSRTGSRNRRWSRRRSISPIRKRSRRSRSSSSASSGASRRRRRRRRSASKRRSRSGSARRSGSGSGSNGGSPRRQRRSDSRSPDRASSNDRSRSNSRGCSSWRGGSAETHVTLLDMRSSDSDSEQERKQVENRRRRIDATKRGLRIKTGDGKLVPKPKPAAPRLEYSIEAQKAREKLRLQTQKVLKRTYAKDKADEIERKELQIKAQIERDEELRGMSYERRARMREQRHRDTPKAPPAAAAESTKPRTTTDRDRRRSRSRSPRSSSSSRRPHPSSRSRSSSRRRDSSSTRRSGDRDRRRF